MSRNLYDISMWISRSKRVYRTSEVVLYFYDIFGTYGQLHIYGAIKEMSFKFNVLVSSRKGLAQGCTCPFIYTMNYDK